MSDRISVFHGSRRSDRQGIRLADDLAWWTQAARAQRERANSPC